MLGQAGAVSQLRRAAVLAASRLLLAAACAGVTPASAFAQEAIPPPIEEAPAAPGDEVAPAPKLLIRGFGNIDLLKQLDRGPGSFSLGQLDLFFTSELAEDLSVLAEIVFEGRQGEGQEPILDVERYQIQYAPSDVFRVALGRMHTVLGYWNQTYHHGAWFQTTAFRPVVYRFEDEGGVLPVHEVGFQVFGAKAAGALQLQYNLSLSNGRGRGPTEIQNYSDANGGKAVNLWLGLAPRPFPGLQLGGVARFDSIPAAAGPSGRSETEERIFGGFLTYQQHGVEVLSEILNVRHEDQSGRSFGTLGLYVQAAYALGRFKPYYRFDRLDRDEDDPFFGPDEPGVRKHTLGLRSDPWTFGCLKLELSHEDPDRGEGFDALALQVAFTF